MNIYSICFLIFGIFFIFLASYSYIKLFYHNKPEYARLQYIAIFMVYAIGILYVLCAIIDHVGVAILSMLIMVNLLPLYRKRKFSPYESDFKEKYPEIYAKNTQVSIKNKILRIIGTLCLILMAIALF